jgi:hypothetical protein
VNDTGTALGYCGYIGGNDIDSCDGIAVDGAGNAYVIGYTNSTEATFPVIVGPDLTYNGGWDVFVAKISTQTELAVDFGPYGLWNYDGSDWSSLAGWDPSGMANWDGGLAVDFDTYGLWNYDGSTWTNLAGWDPDCMEAYGGGLVVDFDAYGVWYYNGSAWTILAGWNAEDMKVWGSYLAVDFGTYGLWNYDGTAWSALASWDPEDMIDIDLY